LREASQYDVIHAHGAWTFTTLTSLLAAKARGCAAVLSPHETLTNFDIEHSPGPVRALKRFLRRVYMRSFDLVVMASELERRDSSCKGTRARVVVVRHPIERTEAPSRRSASITETVSMLRLGFLGRLHPKKNLDVLFRTVGVLPPQVSLSVAGDGDPRRRYELGRLAHEHGIDQRIEWLGFLSGEAKRDFLRSIDLLVMPSAYECFGMAAAEALAAGTPVLVSPRTGIADLVEAYGCGFVAEPTVEGLRRELESVLNEPHRLRRATEHIGAAVVGELSFAAHGEVLRQEYAMLIAGRHETDPQQRVRRGGRVG
jgi:glycosyltransferase involved in cell wall biosynthesis